MAKIVSGGVTIELSRKEFSVLLEMLGNMSRDETLEFVSSAEKVDIITSIYRQLVA